MSHLTEKDLNHLAKLCRLELSVADKEKLLPQLDNIIAFVSQLQQCDTSDVKNITSVEQYTPLREGVMQEQMSGSILHNVKHPIINNAIEITGKLKDVS